MFIEPIASARVGTAPVSRLLAKLAAAKPGNTICDPACGTGHFLVRAAVRIVDRAARHVRDHDLHRVRVHVLRNCVHGSEIDFVTSHVCRRRLWSLAGDTEVTPSIFNQRIHIGHGLVGAPPGTGW